LQIRDIRAFLTIIETGSIRAAAKKLGVSQPALTKTLRAMEMKLGVPLMLRSVDGVSPTEYGKAFVPRATLINEELLRASEELSQMSGHKGGYVSIGISPVVSLFLGVPALNRLWQHHPLANVHIWHGQYEYLVAGIQDGKLDFSVGPIPISIPDKRVTTEPLFQHGMVPIVRQGHPLAKARSLSELQKASWILPSGDPQFHSRVSQNFLDLGLSPPRVAASCESFPALIELITTTDFIAASPGTLLRHAWLSTVLTEIKVRERMFFTSMGLMRHSGVPLTPLAENLAMEFRRLSRSFARAPGPGRVQAAS
jgi:LysR family transcriptional regulator of abg operon